MWVRVLKSKRVCPRFRRCALCGCMCTSLGGCAQVWEGVPGGCAPDLEGVRQIWRVCPKCGMVWTGLINIVPRYFLKKHCDMTTDLLLG